MNAEEKKLIWECLRALLVVELGNAYDKRKKHDAKTIYENMNIPHDGITQYIHEITTLLNRVRTETDKINIDWNEYIRVHTDFAHMMREAEKRRRKSGG